MKILFFIFIFINLSCSTNKDSLTTPNSDDYIIKFSYVRGQDVYNKGQIIGNVFYIYQDGTINSFNIVVKQDNKFIKSWILKSTQIDSLHSLFEITGFNSFPDFFPMPPIIGPASSTSISYRLNKESEFKKIHSILSQKKSRYPDGFFKIYYYLKNICFENK